MTNQELKKTFGEQRPSEMNRDMIESEDNTYSSEYSYLNMFLKNKVIQDEDYVSVDYALW